MFKKRSDSVNKEELKEFSKNIKNAFGTLKIELNDHLDGINANTDEISKQMTFLYELEQKIEKLDEKIENISIDLGNMKKRLPEKEGFFPMLSKNEQKVFVVLYTSSETPLSCFDIASKVNMPELSVKKLIENLISKGIPLLQKKFEGRIFFSLDPNFRELQAKKNVLSIDVNI